MRKIVAIVLFLMLTAGVARAQVGYPRQCCDDPSNPTACEWETCAEMRAGTSTASPNYMRLVDIDSNLGLDLTRYTYAIPTITNLQMRVLPTVSLVYGLVGGVPGAVTLDSDYRLIVTTEYVADDDDTGACHALAVASNQHTLTAAGMHTVSCTGNSCPIMCGANPTAGTAANAHFIKIPDGGAYKVYLTGPKCAYIAGSGVATGEVCFTYEGL